MVARAPRRLSAPGAPPPALEALRGRLGARPAVRSVAEFLDRVFGAIAAWGLDRRPMPPLWYRGVRAWRWALTPGAYRGNGCDELSLFLRFRSDAPLLLPREPVDDWDWYVTMQHYGIPTRLLDWTESPLVALFFAVADAEPGDGPGVWLLDPFEFNRATFGWEAGHVLDTTHDDLAAWLPLALEARPTTFTPARGLGDVPRAARSNAWPVAIAGRHGTARSRAQRGTFTVHGVDVAAIDEHVVRTQGPDRGRIDLITVEPRAVPQLQRELRQLAFTRSLLFPEPENLAADLRAMYVRP